MRSFKEIFIIFIMSTLVLLNISGCSNKEKDIISEPILAEQKLTVPEELDKIFKITKCNDGLRLIGKTKDNNLICFKADNNFCKLEEINIDFINENIQENKMILYADINSQEEILIQYIDKDNIEKISLIDINNLDIATVNLASNSNKACIHNNGQAIIYNYEQEQIKQYDIKNNTLIKEYHNIVIPEIETTDTELIISDSDKEEIDIYDIQTGECIKSIDKISEFNNEFIFSDKVSNDIYFKNNEGIYKYTNDDNEVNLLFNTNNTQLNNTNIELNKCLVIDENNILAYTSNSDGSDNLIYKYSFGESQVVNLQTTKAKENTKDEFIIYSLYENENIRNYILNFKDRYPELDFKYEYGISEGQDINERDAILSLNTRLMAGDGPDLLFLDYLNIDSYIEKGILEDIDDIVTANKDNLFMNIIDAYKKEDKIYTVPTTFNIPMIIGKNVSNIKDLNSLVSRCEENTDNEKILLNISSAEELIDTFYESISLNILKEDKTLNIEAIEKSLKELREIYELAIDNLPKNQQEIIANNRQYLSDFISMYLVHKNAEINLISIKNYKQISFISALKEKYKCDYTVWNGENGNYFKGIDIVGVNSNGKNKIIAKEFVNSLLNGDFYNAEFSNLSVNKEVFIKILDTLKEGQSGVAASDEEGDVLESITLNNEDIEIIISEILTLNKVVNVNNIILDKIKDEIIGYVEGDLNIEEVLNNINKNLEIYLSE